MSQLRKVALTVTHETWEYWPDRAAGLQNIFTHAVQLTELGVLYGSEFSDDRPSEDNSRIIERIATWFDACPLELIRVCDAFVKPVAFPHFLQHHRSRLHSLGFGTTTFHDAGDTAGSLRQLIRGLSLNRLALSRVHFACDSGITNCVVGNVKLEGEYAIERAMSELVEDWGSVIEAAQVGRQSKPRE